MKPYARVLNDTLTFKKKYVQYGVTTDVETLYQRAFKGQYLTCGPMIKGDHKTPNNWSFTKTEYNGYAGRYVVVDHRGDNVEITDTYDGPWGAFVAPSADIKHTSYDDALSKVFEALKGTTNLAVDAIQAKQTLNMIDYAKRGARFVYGAKKRLLKRGGEAWLEYIYGWRPLMSSVYDTAVALTDKAGSDGYTITKKASSTNSTVEHKDMGVDFLYRKTAPVKTSASERTLISLNVRAGSANMLLSRLTSLDPAVIAYELIPFSFIVDWVYDIGGYLSALEEAYRYQGLFAGGFVTTTQKFEATGNFNLNVRTEDNTGHEKKWTLQSASAQASTRTVNLSRVLMTKFPSPRPPSLNINLGATRMITTASLLSLALKDKKQNIRNFR